MYRTALLACLLVLAPAAVRAGEDHSGKDESLKDYSGKNLAEANFEDAVCKLTRFSKAALTKANFQGADLTQTDLSYADLTEADFRNANMNFTSFYYADLSKAVFEGCDLSKVTFSGVKLREANLRNAKGVHNSLEADFYKADVRGADLTGMGRNASFRKAMYDKNTRWPKDFDLEASGAVLVETPAEPVKPVAGDKSVAEAFAKLDVNEDGRLSGSEMKGLEALDVDKNGRITFEEFAAGTKK